MAPTADAQVDGIYPGKDIPLHPLNPLTGPEIINSANLLRKLWPANTDLRFKSITLLEPPKAQLARYLDEYHTGKTLPTFPRKSFASYYIRNTVCSFSLTS